MSETVEPALTPEEWKVGAKKVYLEIRQCPIEDGDLFIEPTHHGLAALLLHGKPFGFTREDVEALREAFQGPFWDGFPGRARMLSLAARIEALLPPTPTETP